jgi:hypothetical protein
MQRVDDGDGRIPSLYTSRGPAVVEVMDAT